MTRGRRIGLWIAGIIVGLLVLIAVSSLLFPSFIAQHELRGRLLKELAERTGGQVDFESIKISLLPPHGTLSKLRVSIPEKGITGKAESVTAYLRILPLIKGSIRISRMQFEAPQFSAALPKITPAPQEELSPESAAENLAGAIHAGLSTLKILQPDILLSITNGKLSLISEGNPAFEFGGIHGEIDLSKDSLDMRIRASSNLWESFSLTSQMDFSRMEGKGRMEVGKLQPQKLFSVLAPSSNVGIEDSEVNARIRFQMKGIQHIEGSVAASSPKLSIRRLGSTIPLSVNSLTGEFRFADRQRDLRLTNLEMGYPRLQLAGRLTEHLDTSMKFLEANAREVDLKEVRDLALALAGDLPAVSKAFDAVLGGTIKQAVFKSQGRSLDELTEPANMDAQAEVKGIHFHIPGLIIVVEDAAGRVSLSGGIFKGQGLEARYGNTRASAGDLSLGVEGENRPFHLDVNLSADLSQVPPVLLDAVKDKDFLEEIKRIKQVEGSAQGRLVLGERLDDVNARVEIARMQFGGQYERIPHPVEISEGQFSYAGKKISVRNVSGRIGESSLSRVSGEVDWGKDSTIEVTMDRASVDLGQVYSWLSSEEGLKALLRDLESVKGKVDLRAPRLRGPFKNPREWIFQGKGRMEEVLVKSPRFPGTADIVSGDFDATPERIEFEKIRFRTGDSYLITSGSVTGYMNGPLQVDAGFEGTVEPILRKWLSDILAMPPELRLRSPFSISAAHLVWGEGVQTAFSGDIRLSTGPRIAFHITKGPGENEFAVKDLTIQEDDSRASLSMDVREDAIDLQFKGSLDAATMDKMFEKSDQLSGWIRGDFTAHFLKDKPEQSRLEGGIRAGDITLPASVADRMRIQWVILGAAEKSVWIESARFSWKGMDFLLHGTDLDMKEKKINLTITEGRMCEISTEEAGGKILPDSNQPLSCILDSKEVGGQFDLAETGSKDLLRNLQFSIKAGEGRIYRFGLLSKILAVVNITEILKGQAPDLGGKGLGFKSADFIGTVKNGVIDLKEGAIDGRSVGLAFDGKIDPPAGTLDITVLVAPFRTVDSILAHIPIVSGIFGKDFIAIPVRAKGNLSDPTVVPMSPTAVGSELLGIVRRTLKLPFKLFQPFLGEKKTSEQQ